MNLNIADGLSQALASTLSPGHQTTVFGGQYGLSRPSGWEALEMIVGNDPTNILLDFTTRMYKQA